MVTWHSTITTPVTGRKTIAGGSSSVSDVEGGKEWTPFWTKFYKRVEETQALSMDGK
jgi:hypothetical protein